MSILKSAALAYIHAGIPVFPLLPGEKIPATKRGFYDATIDEHQIETWWNQKDFNIGICPDDAGWIVVDIDPGGILDLPESYRVKTPRGGTHYYFEGHGPSTVGKLAPHVDTRGKSGYVVACPSVVNGHRYEIIDDRAPVAFPAELSARLAAGNHPAEAAIEELDLAGNIYRARTLLADYVGRGDVAVAGSGGNLRTYRLACEVQDLGITPDTAQSLIEELWNPHCVPPWDSSELGVIVGNASRYAQNEAGAWAVAPVEEVFGSSPEHDTKPASRFHFEDEEEMEQGEEVSWIVPELIPELATVLIVGASGSYKSFLALDIGLSVSTGMESFGVLPSTGPVFYAALEGRHNIKKARRRAWKLGRNVESVPNFYVGIAPMISVPGQATEFGKQIVERCDGRQPKLVILDTLAKCMAGLNENDAGDAGRFIQFCDSLVHELGCSVIAIHHTGKDDTRGARGSSAFMAGFDTVLDVKAHRATRAVSVHVIKHKDAEEREKPWTFEGKTIGESLVFFPTDAKQHHALTHADDLFVPEKIGKALVQLNAYGKENAVTTAVLATQITPALESESVEDHQLAIARTSKILGNLARSKLMAYCERIGRDLRWSMPSAPASSD